MSTYMCMYTFLLKYTFLLTQLHFTKNKTKQKTEAQRGCARIPKMHS